MREGFVTDRKGGVNGRTSTRVKTRKKNSVRGGGGSQKMNGTEHGKPRKKEKEKKRECPRGGVKRAG